MIELLFYKTYEDLLREIHIINIRLESYKEELKKIKKLGMSGPKGMQSVDYTKGKVMSSNQIDFMYAIERVSKLQNHIQIHEKELDRLHTEKKQIDNEMEKLTNKEKKLFYLRKGKGLTQEQAAETLGITTRQVRRIEKKIEIKL